MAGTKSQETHEDRRKQMEEVIRFEDQYPEEAALLMHAYKTRQRLGGHIHASALIPVQCAPKQGRNEPCACGSGMKFKNCCGKPR